MNEKNKMFFFGAGASYGSENDAQYKPPVGEELFDELKTYDKNGWGLISEEFAQKFRCDFENGMFLYIKKNPGHIIDLHKSMAQYFYQFIPTPESLYFKLAKKILDDRWNGCLVSINYERLFKLSFNMAVQFKKKKLPIPQIELILPHGCCDIFIDEKTVYINPNQYVDGIKVGIDGPIVVAETDSEFNYKINNNKVPPVMCYYEPLKRETSGRGFIKNQRKKFEEEVLKADIICIVGVKVNCSDYHIWGPLTKTKGRLLYCSGEDSGKEFKEWKRYYRKNKNDKIIYSNFDEGFAEICEGLEI